MVTNLGKNFIPKVSHNRFAFLYINDSQRISVIL